jgi:hypothetical protein
MGSGECDIGAMKTGNREENRKEKILSLSFFQPLFLSLRQQVIGVFP